MGPSQYVVVGAGLAGAATAWSLARQGHEVSVVERAQPAAPDGSSHGSARIFRYAYPDAFYTRLVVEAKNRWDELERVSEKELITRTGSLDFGALREVRLLADVLSAAGVPGELVARKEAARRWPQVRFDTDVLWHPDAGVIDAESAVLAMTARSLARMVIGTSRLAPAPTSSAGCWLPTAPTRAASTPAPTRRSPL